MSLPHRPQRSLLLLLTCLCVTTALTGRAAGNPNSETETINALRETILASSRTCNDANPPVKDAADRIFIAYILKADITDADRARLLDRVKKDQDQATGQLPALHTFGMAIRALNMAGDEPPVPLRFLADTTEASLITLVESLDWDKPWKSSIEVLHAATPWLLAHPGEGEAFFAALETFQADNGGWGNDTPHAQMAAAFHFIPLYRAANRPLPRLKQLAGIALHTKINRIDFGVMDAAYTLWYAVESGAIEKRATRRFRADLLQALQDADGKFGDRHNHVAAAQCLAVAQWLGDTPPTLRDGWEPTLWTPRQR